MLLTMPLVENRANTPLSHRALSARLGRHSEGRRLRIDFWSGAQHSTTQDTRSRHEDQTMITRLVRSLPTDLIVL